MKFTKCLVCGVRYMALVTGYDPSHCPNCDGEE